MWKPGQLVTIRGIVYRVKRSEICWRSCSLCALNQRNGFCELQFIRPYNNHNGRYPIPYNCYFERVYPKS